MNQVPDELTEIDALITKAQELVERRSHEALPLAEKIMALAISKGDPKYYTQAKYILAFYNCLVANNYDKAIQFCEDLLNNLEEDDLTDVNYKIYMTLGNSYQLKGDIFSAEQSYMKGLRRLESRKELKRGEKGFLASFYYNLSLVLSSTTLGISSEEYLEKAIAINEEIENFFKLSKSYIAYADIFEKKKEYTKAIEFLNKALVIDEKVNDPYSIALCKANLGTLNIRIHDYEKAFEYLKSALCYFEDNHMLYETARVKMDFAEVLKVTGKLDKAIDNLFHSEKLFSELDNKQELNRLYEILSDYLRERRDFELSLEYHHKYSEGLKYFFDVEKTKALTRAKKEFESEQKDMEAAMLRQKNEEIKHYVAKVEQSNSQLKQFAGVASHDLREPLRMISSYIVLLHKTMNGNTTPQQVEFMDFIRDGAKRMDGLINDLLQLAKVDANPRPEEVNLNVVMQEIKMNIGVLMKEKEALVIYPELPKIMVDRVMIIQLFQNLISNGIKYNESTTPIIKINCRRSDNKLEITVTDNGIGIPENQRERAFQIFQRLNPDKKYSGTGIGLAICKKVVESLDGTIFITDHKGGGSVFTISLPSSLICSVKK